VRGCPLAQGVIEFGSTDERYLRCVSRTIRWCEAGRRSRGCDAPSQLVSATPRREGHRLTGADLRRGRRRNMLRRGRRSHGRAPPPQRPSRNRSKSGPGISHTRARSRGELPARTSFCGQPISGDVIRFTQSRCENTVHSRRVVERVAPRAFPGRHGRSARGATRSTTPCGFPLSCNRTV